MIEGVERWEDRLQEQSVIGMHLEIWAWFLAEIAIDCADESNWWVKGQERFEKISQKNRLAQ